MKFITSTILFLSLFLTQCNSQKTTESILGTWELNMSKSKINDDDLLMPSLEFTTEGSGQAVRDFMMKLTEYMNSYELGEIYKATGWLPQEDRKVHSEGKCHVNFLGTTHNRKLESSGSYMHYSLGDKSYIMIIWDESVVYREVPFSGFSYDPAISTSNSIEITDILSNMGTYSYMKK